MIEKHPVGLFQDQGGGSPAIKDQVSLRLCNFESEAVVTQEFLNFDKVVPLLS